MSPQDFAYWLQGAFEVSPEMLEKGMTPEQVQTIQDHLNLVITKVTPNRFEEEKKKTPTLKDLREEGSSPSTGPSREFEFEFNPFPGTPGGRDVNGNVLYC